MLKLVKNEFFIYCKETRIESKRSFYGSFSLGPFDAGQSLTIANALRRTLLSELKGLAITSAEIEGAFHEYSTLPGVKDSILDILLNLKDIVLKTENYGNKKRGTSYATTFKKTQIGYLKTRGPGIITASELKLPPGIQCVDPEQYIATLSEEGVLNIKIVINEGKNYVVKRTSLQNLTHQKDAANNNLAKELISSFPLLSKGDKMSEAKGIKKATKLKKKQLTQMILTSPLALPRLFSPFPSRERNGSKPFGPSPMAASFPKGLAEQEKGDSVPFLASLAKQGKGEQRAGAGSEKVALHSSQNFEASTYLIKKRGWLRKTTLLNIGNSFLFFDLIISNSNKRLSRKEPKSAALPLSLGEEISPLRLSLFSKGQEGKKELVEKEKSSAFSILLMKKNVLFSKKKREGFKEDSNLPPWLKSLFENNQNQNLVLKPSLISFSNPRPALRDASSLPFVKQGAGQEFFEEEAEQLKGKGMGGLVHLREGEALRASKAVALSIDAVFMPVNRVNYIIETNEQSVMLKNTSLTNFAFLTSMSLSQRAKSSVLVTSKKQINLKSESGFNIKKQSTTKKTFLKSTAAHNLLRPLPKGEGEIARNEAVSKSESVLEKVDPLFTHTNTTKKDLHKNNHYVDLVYSRSLSPLALRERSFPSGLFLSLASQRERKQQGAGRDWKEEDNKRKSGGNFMRLSENDTKIPLKNNIIIEVWTNGSIHPRQALYEACKNLLSLFSKLEKATPLAFPTPSLLGKEE